MKSLLSLVLLVTSSVTAAQWNSVQRLKAGNAIELKTKDGKTRQAVVVSTSAESLVVRTDGGEESVERGAVERIRQKATGRRNLRGAIGMAIGAGAGAGLGLLICPSCENESGRSLAGPGAAIGAGLGALGFLGSDYKTIYRAPR
jgi:hypothetical protein